MWLLYRVFILTAFFISAGSALAQQTTDPQQQAVLPAPSQTSLTQQPLVAQQVAPAPTIQPLMSPQDQAIREKRAAAEAAAQQKTTQQSPAVSGDAAIAAATNPQQVQQPAQQPVVTTPQQQQLQQVPIIAPPPQETSATPITPQPSATATPAAVVPQAQNVQGFSTNMTGGTIPTTTGLMPITNTGIDMNLQPNIVGGVDAPPGSVVEQVPYEVQLQQRTQELQQQARGIAFEQAKRSALPMEPYEIRDVLSRLKDTQEAIQTPVRPVPKAANVIKTISTDPGVKPPTIHLYANNVTTVNIIDVTGEPWPVVDLLIGGPFKVNAPEPGGHVIRITPMKDFARGNLVVRLLKLTTPLTFTLEAGGETVDYRFDARIPELGPNAKTPVIDEGITAVAGDKITTSFLEGVPPSGAEKLTVEGVDARTSAYKYASALYVRTPLSLLSPAWQGSATSSDGMNVYVLEDTPVLLLSDKGSLVRAHLGQKDTVASTK